MVQTLEYWNPVTGNYALVAPGILVLTDDTNWNVLNQNTGMYVPAAFPATFRQMVHEGLTCLNHTVTGQVILAGIASIGFGVIMLLQPAAGALVLVLWIGAWALVFGILLMILAFKLRRIAHEPHGIPAHA